MVNRGKPHGPKVATAMDGVKLQSRSFSNFLPISNSVRKVQLNSFKTDTKGVESSVHIMEVLVLFLLK